MAKIVGDIAVQVGADISGLQDGLAKGGRAVKNFDGRVAAMGRNMVKIGAIGVAAAGGVAVIAKSAVNAAAEIENLSRIADATPERFQRMAEAARKYGVSQEKLADVLKDVNDKVGDFMVTGGGPLKDFFTEIAPQVGVTADMFKDLAAPDALQLYVDTLERAGSSQSEMTFHLEAMASDLTALLPLLQNGGEEMRTLGDRAQEAGRILSDEAVRGSAALRAEMDVLGSSMRTGINEQLLQNKEEIQAIVDLINNALIPALGFLVKAIGTVAEGYQKWGEAYHTLKNKAGLSFEQVDPATLPKPNTVDIGSNTRDLFGGGGRTAPGPDLNTIMNDALSGGGGTSRLDGSAGDDLLLGGAGGDTLGTLSESLENRMQVISDFASREIAITQDRVAQIAQIEAAASGDRLSAYQGAFGDLAGLMRTENDKLFKIGQAAALVQAKIEGYSAAVSAWDKGMKIGGPPLAAVFTAASLAKTGALIASIASASPRGGGGQVNPGGGAVAAQPAVSRSVAIELQGETFGRRQVISLINQINEAVEDGAELRLT